MKACPHCGGTGKVQYTDDAGTREAICQVCGGDGRVPDDYPEPAAPAEPS